MLLVYHRAVRSIQTFYHRSVVLRISCHHIYIFAGPRCHRCHRILGCHRVYSGLFGYELLKSSQHRSTAGKHYASGGYIGCQLRRGTLQNSVYGFYYLCRDLSQSFLGLFR